MTMNEKGKPTSKVGNLTRAPELQYGKSGIAYCKFGLAVTPHTPQGEPEAETVFYEVVAFGDFAANVAETITKGDRVLVIGSGKLNTWKDRQGHERTTKEIVADACGPDLRFSTAQIARTERIEVAPPSNVATGYDEDEEPF